jgi:hypothetical protein
MGAIAKQTKVRDGKRYALTGQPNVPLTRLATGCASSKSRNASNLLK